MKYSLLMVVLLSLPNHVFSQNPSSDSLYQELKRKNINEMTEREYDYYMKMKNMEYGPEEGVKSGSTHTEKPRAVPETVSPPAKRSPGGAPPDRKTPDPDSKGRDRSILIIASVFAGLVFGGIALLLVVTRP